MASGFAATNDPKFLTLVKAQMARLTAEYLQFMSVYILPAMQQGAGGSKAAPLIIPPIGFTPNPQQPVTLPMLFEPIGEAVAYGALFCTGVGLDKSADVDEIYVSLPTFSGGKTQFFKTVAMNLVSGEQANDPNNLGVHLGSTMIKCKNYIKNMCQGACNSGKCGQSLALGVACNHFCEDGFLNEINTCTKQFYVGQIVAKNALVNSPLNPDPNLNLNSIPPIAY
jgi:hypothetical protein